MIVSVDYIKQLAKKGMRIDKRGFEDYRKPITIEYGVSAKSAEGSARVTIGDTIVVAGVKLEKGTPFPDKPDEGTIVVNVELLPLSSPEYESGPPGIDSIELSRVVDRGLRESGAIDFKKLCIKPGEAVWMVMIDIYPINSAGNLFDACALAALAALKDTKFPKIDENLNVEYKERTDIGLPLNFLPVSCTLHMVGNKFLVDPTSDEEAAAEARITIAMTDDLTICAMQKGGERPFAEDEIFCAIDIAEKKTTELRAYLASAKAL